MKKTSLVGNTGSLAGHLLVATPAIAESCFTRSVIYISSHNESGAMGIIINHAVDSVAMKDIFEQLKITPQAGAQNLPVHFGGPVEANRGFILHTNEYHAPGTISDRDGIAVTANVSLLEDLAHGLGPQKGMLLLGYSGWGAGQLESEIESGSWIVVPATKQLVFDTDNDLKWSMAIASLGFDMGHFSTVVGHA